MQVSHLNLPQFPPLPSYPDNVSYGKETDSYRVRQLDLSKVQRPIQAHAVNSSQHASDSDRLPMVPSNSPLPPTSAASQLAAASSADIEERMPMLSSSSTAAAAAAGLAAAQHAQQAGPHIPATAAFKLPTASGPASPQQTSRLAALPKSWQLYSPAGTAHEPVSLNSNHMANKAWQKGLAGTSAHEQWVMQRHLTHGRMSDTGCDEEWGELQVRLPRQASSNAEKSVQELPEGLWETRQMCSVRKGKIIYIAHASPKQWHE